LRPAILAGAGNLFAVATSAELAGRPAAEVARAWCAREGLDGLLEVRPAARGGDVGMVIWNADGSRAEACGNGLRCVALFARERGLAAADRLRVETDGGTRAVELLRRGGAVVGARASLGRARILDSEAEIPLAAGAPVRAVLVDVTNPHCVVFVAPGELGRITALGPLLARHARFPAGTNVELAAAGPGAARFTARVFERGVGETAACGTGAAAIAVAAAETGRGALPLAVGLPGGVLEVDRDLQGEVWLTGPVANARGPAT
jgi:diaminopimelate epimerase